MTIASLMRLQQRTLISATTKRPLLPGGGCLPVRRLRLERHGPRCERRAPAQRLDPVLCHQAEAVPLVQLHRAGVLRVQHHARRVRAPGADLSEQPRQQGARDAPALRVRGRRAQRGR